MIPLVQDHKDELFSLCRNHGVRKLDLFGSAAIGTFDAATSDLDFVVDFSDYGSGIARRFFEFSAQLEELFDRPVDLVFDSEMKNPYLRSLVNSTREPLYDANGDGEAAA